MDRETREKMFNDNMGLVYKVATTYHKGIMPSHGDDILQEGFVALLEAIDRFDESKGNKFSTFAYNTIWGKVQHFVDTKIYQKKKTSLRRENGKGFKTGLMEANICSLYTPFTLLSDEELLLIDTIGEEDANFSIKENQLCLEEILNIVKDFEASQNGGKYSNMYKVLLLKYEGYSVLEIAEMLECSHTTVQNKFDLIKDYFKSKKGEYLIAN